MALFGVQAVAVETYVASVGILASLSIVLAYGYFEATSDDEFEDVDSEETLEPPNIRKSLFGPAAAYLHLRKKRKLAGNGYVQWFLVHDGWPRPKYVQPEDKGGGQFEYEHKGETYLFPRDAMLASRDEGMWTVIHDKGESVPRNLRQPEQFGLSAKQLHDYVTARVTIDPPGWLSKLNLDPATMIKYALFAFIGFVLLQGMMNGGVP